MFVNARLDACRPDLDEHEKEKDAEEHKLAEMRGALYGVSFTHTYHLLACSASATIPCSSTACCRLPPLALCVTRHEVWVSSHGNLAAMHVGPLLCYIYLSGFAEAGSQPASCAMARQDSYEANA